MPYAQRVKAEVGLPTIAVGLITEPEQAEAIIASAAAIAGLRRISAGSWSDDVAKDAAHKQQVAAQYAALQGARGAGGYEDKLLGFYAMLDPDEDRYYAKAVDADAPRSATARCGAHAS